MKCLVLAGGKGNSLWPLSREDYPKQFMNIKEHHSLLQETIVRNIPYCEEFLIATNENYYFIVEGQMKVFQGLKYRCFLEEVSKSTAAAITLTCMCCNPTELIFVVASDQLMEEGNYKEAVLRAQELARKGNLVTFGVEPKGAHTRYGYIQYKGEEVYAFREKPDYETAKEYLETGNYYWNSGNFLFIAGLFLNEMRKYSPAIYETCKKVMPDVKKSGKCITYTKNILEHIPAANVENALFEKSMTLKVVLLNFKWCDVGELETLASFMHDHDKEEIIENNCSDLTVINRAENKLIITNEVKNLIVVNTEDAIYISQKGKSNYIKEIMQDHRDRYKDFFEVNPLRYRPWGNYEVLKSTQFYKVKKATIYPGKSQSFHRHNLRSEHWSVVKGTARITLGKDTKEYHANEGVYVPIGMSHKVANTTDDDVIIIEVSMGTILAEEDTVRMEEVITADNRSVPDIVRLEPAYKDYLWGGSKLRDVYRKDCDYETIAESWELSAHHEGQSIVASGKNRGMLFGEYIQYLGKEVLGWKSEAFDKFPVLIKFIDAKDKLSIQVHPDDEYALRNEDEYGKNEVWYIIDCEEGASVYYGLKNTISKEELQERIEKNTVTEVLNEIKVKKGDIFFVETGMIHAIGNGILICEIQQNSNCTYRLYDYDRRDRFGNLRELHLDKALNAVKYKKGYNKNRSGDFIKGKGFTKQLLAQCKYFESTKYVIEKSIVLNVDTSSFYSIIIIEGIGKICINETSIDFCAGESFFIPAAKKDVTITGACTIIGTHI